MFQVAKEQAPGEHHEEVLEEPGGGEKGEEGAEASAIPELSLAELLPIATGCIQEEAPKAPRVANSSASHSALARAMAAEINVSTFSNPKSR